MMRSASYLLDEGRMVSKDRQMMLNLGIGHKLQHIRVGIEPVVNLRLRITPINEVV